MRWSQCGSQSSSRLQCTLKDTTVVIAAEQVPGDGALMQTSSGLASTGLGIDLRSHQAVAAHWLRLMLQGTKYASSCGPNPAAWRHALAQFQPSSQISLPKPPSPRSRSSACLPASGSGRVSRHDLAAGGSKVGARSLEPSLCRGPEGRRPFSCHRVFRSSCLFFPGTIPHLQVLTARLPPTKGSFSV